jgi:integrase
MLWRVGRRPSPLATSAPRPLPPEETKVGNRFDSLAGRFACLYLASDSRGCFMEVLGRLKPDERLAALVADEWQERGWMRVGKGTGARRGELLGLRWREVDLDAGHITISRGLSFVEGVPRLLGTKTSRRRVVSIGASVIDALRRHEEQQRAKREAATDWQDRWGLVFTQADGAPIDPLAVTKEFRALVRSAPVPVIRLQDVRHAHASILLGEGVPIPAVSRRLGHATVSMTLDVYSHVLPGMDAEAAAKIETALRHGGAPDSPRRSTT